MFMSYESTNACHFDRIRLKIVILAWTLMICFGGQTLRVMTHNNDAGQTAKSEAPLLLNSGIAQAQDAEVSVILWFEDRNIPVAIRTSKPTPEWIWTYKELQMVNEVSATLTGQQILNKSEENSLYAWYTTMVPQIEKAGGEIYLDERINQAVDISAYLSQTNADPAQWVLIDNMISTAAYQKNIGTSVIAGQDQINIQLLSRGKGNEGQSVLAIPALLKEF
ncbi:hypothetical protein [Desulfosporosinus nitroreducens]|uniref:Uncharacterized protein n=1 Tax=Desulfosporosinus nitroreducens TaxID=2018668 RepID=A0ABT8QL25_9FIRM|nr:hypothetical protein [Desulfosporosinus nitroreducens]MDO0822024.1 hypothetical protein [Desulfosporosinus nitroreducens]